MSDSEMTPEAAEELVKLGYDPEEWAAYLEITESWNKGDGLRVEIASQAIMREALTAIGQMRSRAPSFLHQSAGSFTSAPSGTINKVTYEGCYAMSQAALNGDARASGQLARLTAMLTETLAKVIEKTSDPETEKEFAGAKKEISEVASWLPYWPVLFYSGSKGEVQAILQTFAEIGVGSACPIQLTRPGSRAGKPSLSTPMNQLVWETMAELYKLRARALEFRKRQALATRLQDHAGDTKFFKDVLALSLVPGAMLAYVCEGIPNEEEALQVERMLELEDLNPRNAETWAREAVFPTIWRTLPSPEAHPAFANIFKRVASRGEILAQAKQEVLRALRRLIPRDC